jgi:hypothetical protein
MRSIREVTREYNSVLKAHDGEKSRGVNCYICTVCKQITKTIDIDPGTTPFIFECFHCGGEAQSTFYKDIAPDLKPVIEWYRPSLDDTFKLRRIMKEGLLDHVLMGGLLDRKINQSL